MAFGRMSTAYKMMTNWPAKVHTFGTNQQVILN